MFRILVLGLKGPNESAEGIVLSSRGRVALSHANPVNALKISENSNGVWTSELELSSP